MDQATLAVALNLMVRDNVAMLTPDSTWTPNRPPRVRHAGRQLRALFTVSVYIVLALQITWPMPRAITRTLPMGTEAVATVPLFNLWTVWWNADRAAAGLHGYWDAPIFYPTTHTFSLSEVQPTTLAVAPLAWSSDLPILAYNVYLLMALALNGLVGYQLLRQRGFDWWPALCGGVLVETLPFVVWQLGVLQLTVLWALLWTISALWKWDTQPRWTSALELGLAFGMTYLSCNYYGLFLALLLVPTASGLCYRHATSLRAWGQIVVAGLLAVVLMAPLVMEQQRSAREHQWERETALILDLSAHVRDYSNTPFPQWLDRYEFPETGREGWTLGPALGQWLFAFVGVVCGLANRSWRRWTLFALGLGCLAFILSLGPRLELWGLSPYRGLGVVVPGVAQIRSPFRFAVFVQIATTWLAVLFLQALIPKLDGVQHITAWRQRLVLAAAWLPAVLAGCVLMAETRPVNRRHYVWPTTEWPQWVEYLRDETPPETSIVCLPFANGTTIHEYESVTQWMAWGMEHRRRMVNGYSGYFPDPYLYFKGALGRFPATGADMLVQRKVDLAVVDRRRLPPEQIVHTEPTSTWVWLYSDDVAMIDIYRIMPPPPANVPQDNPDAE